MPSTFTVLAEPTRRDILDMLRERPLSVGELVERLGLSQPGTSKHLRVLREAGLVSVRRQAQRRMYQLCADPLAEVDAWLTPYRELWCERLDALERHLDTMGAGAESGAGPVAVDAFTDAEGADHGSPEEVTT